MKVKQTQAFVFALLCAQNSQALELSKIKTKNHNEHGQDEFVETQDLGSKMSSLSLNMLNKSEQQESVPSDNVMLQTSQQTSIQTSMWAQIESGAYSRNKNTAFNRYMEALREQEIMDHTFLQVRGDDLNDSDIMAYSAKDAGADEGDDSIFSSGGAIMDALKKDKEDDDLINAAPIETKAPVKPVKKAAKKAVKKLTKKQEAKAKKDKEEMDKKLAEKKKLEEQLAKEKKKADETAQDQLEREQKMLKDLEDSDKEHELEMSKDGGGGSGISYAQQKEDEEKAEAQSLQQQTKKIVNAAKNKLYGGMMTSFGVFG